MEYRTRGDQAQQIDKIEKCLAKQAGSLRESLPDSTLRTVYDRQLGQIKGTFSFGKSLSSITLLQKLQIALDWVDPQLHRSSSQFPSVEFILGKAYRPLESGTPEENRETVEDLQALAERVYEAAKRRVQEQWAEAKGAGKQGELIKKWTARMLQHPAYASSAGAAATAEDADQRSGLAGEGMRPRPAALARETKTWVEFQLIDVDGNHVSNAMYKVKLPDGSIVNGRLNEQGLVRFNNIDPGQCEITFTEIDAREWHPH